MAAEALNQEYLFPGQALDVDLEMFSVKGSGNEVGSLPFAHNHGHDAESLFWLAMFILFFFKDVRTLQEEEEITRLRRQCCAYIFPGNVTETQGHRAVLISNPQVLAKHADWIRDSFKPVLGPLLRFFSLFRKAYIESYAAPENKTLPLREIRAFKLLIKHMFTTLEACQELSGNAEMRSRKSNGDDQGNTTQQPEPNPDGQQPPEPGPNDQNPPEPKPNNQRPPGPGPDGNPRKREHEEEEEEEYKILDSPQYPRRRYVSHLLEGNTPALNTISSKRPCLQ